ncbi:MAG: bifunctional dihydropteridine reductase/dihydrofolate reductase TmpR [Thermoleophilia bacterium]|nr:bifunctional dihydropteridine reductase/dihydrofolate reductase TmpR [Thermoleophilia bacterium]
MSRGGALVTGAARGIGRGIALALADDGYDVAVHYRSSASDAEAVCAEAAAGGMRSVAVQGDLTDDADAERVVLEAHAAVGPLRVLVNNVGNYLLVPLDELTIAQWDEMLDSNLRATFVTCRTALPLLREAGGGHIVNLGYAGADDLVARPSVAAYAIAKTGVILLTKAIAKAEAGNRITANVVAPGVIENSDSKPLGEIPAGREGTIDEVAAAVRYLVSPAAAYVTGQVIELAGGWNL